MTRLVGYVVAVGCDHDLVANPRFAGVTNGAGDERFTVQLHEVLARQTL
jgi:hypothetical protein